MFPGLFRLVIILLSFCYIIVKGDNRELIPIDAPTNLTLLEITGHQVVIRWDSVDPSSIRGSFKGYLVRTWNHAGSQVYAFPSDVTKASVDFFPFSKNFITVSARNEKYVGPPSEAISFDAPQIEPNHPYVLNVFTLSAKAIFIEWSKPTQPNGILTGYKIYCGEINDTFPDITMKQTSHQINDPDKLQAKLTGLEEGVRYRIGVSAINCAGESDIKTFDITLEPHVPAEPFIPKFIYKINYTIPTREDLCYKSSPTFEIHTEEDGKEEDELDYYDLILNETKKNERKGSKPDSTEPAENEHVKHCIVNCMVMWIPDVKNNPGEYFYLKYKIKGEKEYHVTDPEMSEDYIIIPDFDACKNYEIILIAVDGEYSTESGILVTPTKIF